MQLLYSGVIGFMGDAARMYRLQTEIQAVRAMFNKKAKLVPFSDAYPEVDDLLPDVTKETSPAEMLAFFASLK